MPSNLEKGNIGNNPRFPREENRKCVPLLEFKINIDQTDFQLGLPT